MNPKAVLFDLGGTLWHWPARNPVRDGVWFWGASHDHCARVLPRSAGIIRVGREAYAAAMVAAEQEYRRRARSEGRSTGPRDVVSGGLRRLGLPATGDEVSAAVEGYGRVAPGWVRPFPDAAPTLSRLREAGRKTLVLSNTWWSAAWLEADLRELRLADLVDGALYTSDLARAKPHPSVFLEAADRLGVRPEDCVMVGDDPLCDVAGARAAGMRAVWKRAGKAEPGNAGPDAVVDHLAELPALLGLYPT